MKVVYVKGGTKKFTGAFDKNPKPHIPVQPIEAGKNPNSPAVSYINAALITENWVEAGKYNKDYILNSGLFTMREILELRKKGIFSENV
jgi:hypothetical protein